ncbi:MAG: hypothetical protein IKX41_00480 [Oscillospiraceae bacterium]|nr:hypothetical protein [Oscillospiraceae bacterium]
MKKFIRILAHAVFILSLTSITFMILNVYNPLMGFTSSDYSRAIFLSLYVLAAILAVLTFVRGGGKKKAREQQPPQSDTNP